MLRNNRVRGGPLDILRERGGRDFLARILFQFWSFVELFLRCRRCTGIFYLYFCIFNVIVGLFRVINACMNTFQISLLAWFFGRSATPSLLPRYLMSTSYVIYRYSGSDFLFVSYQFTYFVSKKMWLIGWLVQAITSECQIKAKLVVTLPNTALERVWYNFCYDEISC